MQQGKMKIWNRIGEFAGLVALIALIVTFAQLLQSNNAKKSQDSAQSTQITLLQEQLTVQKEIALLQADPSGLGPATTVIVQRITDFEMTGVTLATEEAKVKQILINESEINVLANIEWVNTNMMIDEGQTVDIKYISGKWRGVKDGYWLDGTNCSGSQSRSIVSSANGNALIAKIGVDGIPRCVGNSEFVSPNSGNLYLSYNDCSGGCFSDNEGSIIVHISVFQ